MWGERAVTVDPDLWRGLLSNVFMCIIRELGDSKNYPSGQQAQDIVAQLNQDELEELKSAVRNGVERGDWTDLIEYRMYFLDYRIFRCLIINHSQTQEIKED